MAKKLFSIYVEPEYYLKLKEEAINEERSIGFIIRKAIKYYFETKGDYEKRN